MADYTRDQISFGQGLSVSAVQMAAALAAATNGGVYNPPVIVKQATAADGSEVELPRHPSRRVISEEASKQTVNMMEAVVTQGGQDVELDSYRTAGKTGTAQRFDPKCNCYNGYTASYVGVAPAEDPQLLVYTVIDQPKEKVYGAQVAMPAAQDLLELALPRYNVPPSTTPGLKEPLSTDG